MTPTELHAAVHAAVTAQLDEARKRLYWAQQTSLTLAEPKLLGKRIPGWHDWPAVERLAEWAIRACEADLETLAEHRPGIRPYVGSDFNMDRWWCELCDSESPCDELTRRAEVYSVEVT